MSNSTLLVLILSSALAWGQATVPPAPASKSAAVAKKSVPAPKLTPQQKRAFELLHRGEAQARGLKDAAMSAFSLWQIGEAYREGDPKRAVKVLRDAFQATLEIDPEQGDTAMGGTRHDLQVQILKALLPLDATSVDQLVPEAEPLARRDLLAERIQFALEKKDYARAVSLIFEAGSDAGFPYQAAAELMRAMPDQRQAIFESAKSSFSLEKDPNDIISSEDLGTLIVRFWRDLPPNTVLDAINLVLAKAKDDSQSRRIGVSSDQGSVNFNNAYDYRLFEFLPIIETLDKSQAEDLLSQDLPLEAALAKYPQGMQTLSPNMTDKASGTDPRLMMSMSVGAQEAPSGFDRAQQVQQMVAAVFADFDKSPRQSLARAMALPESLGHRHPRSEALAIIAQRTQRSNPEVSRDAIDELLKILPNLPPVAGADLGAMAARIAQGLGDRQRTEKLLDAALKATGDLLKEDDNQEDSNQALPAFWPSTREYARLVEIGEKFSPEWAEKTLHDIPDDGIRAVVTIAYARVLLNIPSTANTSIRINKQGTMVRGLDSEE